MIKNGSRGHGLRLGKSAAAVSVVLRVMPRRFPPLWSVDDLDMKLGQNCFIVRDRNGQAVAYGTSNSQFVEAWTSWHLHFPGHTRTNTSEDDDYRSKLCNGIMSLNGGGILTARYVCLKFPKRRDVENTLLYNVDQYGSVFGVRCGLRFEGQIGLDRYRQCLSLT
jgi:hypothetical protein